MPPGEEMFNYHGFSGPCPKPPVGKKLLKPFQQRVVDEKRELDEKLARLTNFVSTETFLDLPKAEKDRLNRQHEAMIDYSQVLAERIAAFE